MMGGANVFLTGAPGAGKTYVLNQFIKRAQRAGQRVAVTASTGIAASHLNGTTIHSWSGLGILDELHDEEARKLGASDKLIKRYNAADVLVIDEVSMLHGYRLDMINRLAKILRANDAPFGGLQVVLVGDLFQLPPVSRTSNVADFVHLSAAWAELNLQICYITEQHRQQGNDGLLELLEAMRQGAVEAHHGELLTARINQRPTENTVVTRLYSHNIDVDEINQRHLAALPGKGYVYTMVTKGSKAKLEQLAKGLLVPPELELKLGAEVMFVANNFAEGFVNGSRGQVVDFKNDQPVVKLLNGKEITVEPHSWSLSEDGRVRAEVSQLPLRLAWAITIHKSQGMSLDAAEIDLRRAFTPGMGYVALSRVRSLNGLYLQGLNAMAMNLHPQIYEFDINARQASNQLAASTPDIATEVISQKTTPIVDEVLYSKLKDWRAKRARAEQLPAYIIAHDSTLSAVAAAPPDSLQQLLGISGFGPKKVAVYGPDIIAVIQSHRTKD